MPQLKNFVAVDWRAGKDRIYFFFKDTNTYSRFDIADNCVVDGHPTEITAKNWDSFHKHAKNLRFGFTTTGVQKSHLLSYDSDTLWLFYYDNDTPMVCKYDQDLDRAEEFVRLADSIWHALTPYFDRILAGTWRVDTLNPYTFEFLLNDGHYLILELNKNRTTYKPINERTWPGLAPYKDRIITAVQNDRTILASYYYIFLTHNEYLRYDLSTFQLLAGPIKVNDASWPGLLKD